MAMYIILLILANDYGQCNVDAFSIASPGAVGSPVICNANTGYHSELLYKLSIKAYSVGMLRVITRPVRPDP